MKGFFNKNLIKNIDKLNLYIFFFFVQLW